jgi:hypothetical protein
MTELQEKVAAALCKHEGDFSADELAASAITAVFDWLSEPSKEAISEGISEAEDVVDWTTDTYESWRIDTPSQYPMPIWKVMIAQMRCEALGGKDPTRLTN